jgi:hypothetical protein
MQKKKITSPILRQNEKITLKFSYDADGVESFFSKFVDFWNPNL